MSFEQLARLDLNLLVCLHVLLEQGSVSKAAEQLNLSQSAISKSLARLRIVFDDPLFVRSGYGMEPTPKAVQISPSLHQLLIKIERLTAPSTFVPQNSDRCFRMALIESSYPLLLSHVVSDALSQAPNISFDTRSWGVDSFALLQRGEIDFVITGKDLNSEDAKLTLIPPKGVVHQELYQDHLCCVLKPEHPAIKKQWNLRNYLAQRHVQVRHNEKEQWLLDIKLKEKGFERDIALFVPDFNSAASLCTHTDVILTVPSYFAQYIAKLLNLLVYPLPMRLPPLAYTLFWHQHQGNDIGHQWLRQLIISRSHNLLKYNS